MDILESIKKRLGARIINIAQPSGRRIYISVAPTHIVEAARLAFTELGCRFAIATGIDTPQGFEILYHFSHDTSGEMITFKVLLEDKGKPQIDSITPVVRAAEWIEREIWELLGIQFRHHPNLKHLLLKEDWPEGDYPLRQKGS